MPRAIAILRWCLVAAVAAIFLTAAIAKAVEPMSAVRMMAFLAPWAGTGAGAVGLVVLIVAWEAYLAVFLAINGPNRAGLWCAVVTLLGFSAVLVVLWTSVNPPACGCFGALVSGVRGEAPTGLIRNCALVWVLGWAMHGRRGEPKAGDEPPARTRSGFTLIELLVVISVIAVLIAIALPALSASKKRGRHAASLSTSRQLLVAASLYGQDFADGLPFSGTPGNPFVPVAIRGFALLRSQGYFHDQSWHWISLIAPEYFDAPRNAVSTPAIIRMLREDFGWPDYVIRSHYALTWTAMSDPDLWNDPMPAPELQWFRGGRWTEISFPDRKGLILDVALGYPARSRDVPWLAFAAFADGSAHTIDCSRAPANDTVAPVLAPGSLPVLSTRGGLRGRDF